jgi:hypothetical protein
MTQNLNHLGRSAIGELPEAGVVDIREVGGIQAIVLSEPLALRHADVSGESKERIIDPMVIDPVWLFLSLIPGGIGFVLFVYGKKEGRWGVVVIGLVFMVYPYFTESIVSLVGVGAMLGFLTWWALRGGW